MQKPVSKQSRWCFKQVSMYSVRDMGPEISYNRDMGPKIKKILFAISPVLVWMVCATSTCMLVLNTTPQIWTNFSIVTIVSGFILMNIRINSELSFVSTGKTDPLWNFSKLLFIGCRSVTMLLSLAAARIWGTVLIVSLFSAKVEYNTETATFGRFSHS